MASENLWGELKDVQELRTPTLILKEQALYLGEMTGHTLVGRVTSTIGLPTTFDIYLKIVAPSLNDYTIDIINIEHEFDLYPAKVFDLIGEERYDAENEAELLEALKDILSSDKIQRIVRALYVQSKQAPSDEAPF
jgi:hypothetical protein